MGHRVRVLVGSWALAEVVVLVLVAAWIGVGWTVLAVLATTALGWTLLARQGTRALADLRERARERRAVRGNRQPRVRHDAGCRCTITLSPPGKPRP